METRNPSTPAPASQALTRQQAAQADQLLSSILYELGIPPHFRGFLYLREAVRMAATDPDTLASVTKSLYPQIARQHATTASCVERSIRHAIDVAWRKGEADTFSQFFGCPCGKPSNSVLIALLAEKLRFCLSRVADV